MKSIFCLRMWFDAAMIYISIRRGRFLGPVQDNRLVFSSHHLGVQKRNPVVCLPFHREIQILVKTIEDLQHITPLAPRQSTQDSIQILELEGNLKIDVRGHGF